MDESLKIALTLTYGYLLGSVSSTYLVGRLVKGIDLRQVGSGSLGASNVWQHVGKFWIFPVGIFDLFVKGVTPVLLARYLLDLGLGVQATAGLAAMAGHNWPIFLRFHGGRAVTSMVGVLGILAPVEMGLFVVVSVVGWGLTRSAAVWVLISLLLLPVWSLALNRPEVIVKLMVGIVVVTVVKRLASNSKSTSQVSTPRLLWNRLVYDRDVGDHDAWVRQGTPPDQERE
jgi:glycerol-3-phosphate acyltransferase PlsY